MHSVALVLAGFNAFVAVSSSASATTVWFARAWISSKFRRRVACRIPQLDISCVTAQKQWHAPSAPSFACRGAITDLEAIKLFFVPTLRVKIDPVATLPNSPNSGARHFHLQSKIGQDSSSSFRSWCIPAIQGVYMCSSVHATIQTGLLIGTFGSLLDSQRHALSALKIRMHLRLQVQFHVAAGEALCTYRLKSSNATRS